MPVRGTSLAAYNAIKENGLLSARRFQVYEIIFKNGPVNCRQIIEIASKGNVTNTGAFSGRLSELEKLGVIAEHHTGPCPITGHETVFWIATEKLPVKWEKPQRVKCCQCDGKGYIEETQAKLF